jgi:hypothetical protein
LPTESFSSLVETDRSRHVDDRQVASTAKHDSARKRLSGDRPGHYDRGVTNWLTWHAHYEDAQSPLARRLTVVRRLIEEAVAAHGGTQLRVLSLCAGDGRDVLPVINQWKTRKNVGARLIELDPQLADRARAFVAGINSQELMSYAAMRREPRTTSALCLLISWLPVGSSATSRTMMFAD